jgi:hypothetical protein
MKIFRTQLSLFLSIVGFMTFSLVSCGGDDNGEEPQDTTAPQISLTSPADNDVIVPGTGDLIVEGSLTDDVALSNCKIYLDFTDSGSSAVPSGDDTKKSTTSGDGEGTVTGIDDEPWEPDTAEISLSGKSYDFEAGYEPFGSVPSAIKFGEYTLTIEVTDESENVATEEIVVNMSGQ